MKDKKSIQVLVAFALAALIAFVWWRNETSVSPREGQHSETNVISNRQTAKQTEFGVSRPLYGETSLSEDEKRILHKPFADCGKYWCGARIYRVGMICLKHRLSRVETMKLLDEPPLNSEDRLHLSYRTGVGRLLELHFEENGNLKDVEAIGRDYDFPPLESVTPNTPIEPTPLPPSPR